MGFLIKLAAKKFWLPARARRKGRVGGIPPRPSIPPKRSGGDQLGFSAKWVLTFSNKHHHCFKFFVNIKSLFSACEKEGLKRLLSLANHSKHDVYIMLAVDMYSHAIYAEVRDRGLLKQYSSSLIFRRCIVGIACKP